MKDILFSGYLGRRLPPQVQMARVRQVIEHELTEKQRQILLAYYMERQSIGQIAKARGVHKSSVSRMLRRAENTLRMYLKY